MVYLKQNIQFNAYSYDVSFSKIKTCNWVTFLEDLHQKIKTFITFNFY